MRVWLAHIETRRRRQVRLAADNAGSAAHLARGLLREGDRLVEVLPQLEPDATSAHAALDHLVRMDFLDLDGRAADMGDWLRAAAGRPARHGRAAAGRLGRGAAAAALVHRHRMAGRASRGGASGAVRGAALQLHLRRRRGAGRVHPVLRRSRPQQLTRRPWVTICFPPSSCPTGR